MDLSLKNKNAFVCGSTQGIGKAIAMELALLGANVTLIARNEEKLKIVLKELPNNQQQHDYIVADFSNPTALKSNVNQYMLHSDKTVNILINKSGTPPWCLFAILIAHPFLFFTSFTMRDCSVNSSITSLRPIFTFSNIDYHWDL